MRNFQNPTTDSPGASGDSPVPPGPLERSKPTPRVPMASIYDAWVVGPGPPHTDVIGIPRRENDEILKNPLKTMKNEKISKSRNGCSMYTEGPSQPPRHRKSMSLALVALPWNVLVVLGARGSRRRHPGNPLRDFEDFMFPWF